MDAPPKISLLDVGAQRSQTFRTILPALPGADMQITTTSRAAATPPRILIVSTSFDHVPGTNDPAGLFLSELSTPFHELRNRRATVDVATIAGGMPPLEPRSIDTPEERAVLNGHELNRALRAAPALRDVDTSKYDAIILAG